MQNLFRPAPLVDAQVREILARAGPERTTVGLHLRFGHSVLTDNWRDLRTRDPGLGARLMQWLERWADRPLAFFVATDDASRIPELRSAVRRCCRRPR